MRILITLLAMALGANDAAFTMQTTYGYYFCAHNDGVFGLSTPTDHSCVTLKFTAYAHVGGLVLSYRDKTVCKYLCINKCGVLYGDEMYHTEDCRFTTMAFEGFDQLSVNRGNYSDFVATSHYDILPLSLRHGASQERLEKHLKLTVKEEDVTTVCPLGNVNKNTKTTKECATAYKSEPRKFDAHDGYKSFSVWEKFLIFVGIDKMPKPNGGLRLIEYLKNYA
jgi:hypothetical protein